MTRIEEVEAWYKTNASNIKKMASKRSKQDAEDILQDTALKLLVNPAKWESISRQDTTRRAMWDFYNPTRGFKGGNVDFVTLDKAMAVPSPDDLTEALIAKRSVELVINLVNSLGVTSKKVFEMHFFMDMEYDAIAKQMNANPKWVQRIGKQAAEKIKMKFNQIVDKKMDTLPEYYVPGYNPNVTLEELEKDYILNALKFHKNNKVRAATALGLTEKTLYNKLQKWADVKPTTTSLY